MPETRRSASRLRSRRLPAGRSLTIPTRERRLTETGKVSQAPIARRPSDSEKSPYVSCSKRGIETDQSDACHVLDLEVLIDACRHFPAFGNRPHDQRGPSPHIAACKHRRHVRHEILIGQNIAPRIIGNAQTVQKPISDRSCKSHGEQDQVYVHLEVVAGQRRELSILECYAATMELGDVPVMPRKPGRGHAPLAIASFFMSMP